MNENNLYKDVSRRLIEMMKQTFGDRFKWYYLGAPSFIPTDDMMPCLIVHKVSDPTVKVDATGLDSLTEKIVVDIITNQMDDFNNPDNEIQDTSARKLQNFIEARDLSTGQWLPGTLLESIRTHFTFDDATLGNEVGIDYNVAVRSNLPTIEEALVTITTTSLVQVPERT